MCKIKFDLKGQKEQNNHYIKKTLQAGDKT